MAGKSVWITWLAEDEITPSPKEVAQELQKIGMGASGAPWIDDLEKFSWTELGDMLSSKESPDIWLIATSKSQLDKRSNRFALSLITAMVHENRGFDAPMFILGLDFAPESNDLPLLMRDAKCLSAKNKAWAANLLAATYRKQASSPPEYRFSVRAHPAFGLWFEVGPRGGEWQGVMAGVEKDNGIEITHHAVGDKGMLPERSTLEYPIQGIVAQAGDSEFTAFATQNKLDDETSYFIKVVGTPHKVFFGGYPGKDQADVRVIELD